MRARGRKPASLALPSDIHSTAAAPSEICELLPAVCIPSGSTGLSPARPSRVVSLGPWSFETRVFSPVGPSGPITGASTGAISRSKRPSATATAAFRWDSKPSQSTSSRVMSYFWAMRSAAPNWSGMSQGNSSGRERPGPLNALAPSRTRLIASTPQAMPDWMASALIRLATKLLACWAEPHWQSIVVAATS